MASRGPIRARGWALRAGLLLLAAGACSGTEHAVFDLGVPISSVNPPQTHADAGTEPPPPDAGPPPEEPSPDEDAGVGPDPGLDPTVVFDWQESLPGQGTCKAGLYVGSFTCTVQVDGGTDSQPIYFGAVSFTLDGSPEEQLLSITDGKLSGPLFGGDLSGQLDCLTKHFTGKTVNGMAIIGQAAQSPPGLFPSFDADLDGSFDDQALVIEGTIKMVNDAGQTCEGRFRASATP